MDERTSPTAQPSNQARFINNNPIKFTQKSFDDQLTFKDNIARTPQSGECALHNIRKIRPFLKEQAAQLLALVISRLNNENALLAGLPSCAIESLKMIQNTAGWLVFNEPKCYGYQLQFASILRHWCLDNNYRTGAAPFYLNSLLRVYIPSRSLGSVSEQHLVVPSLRGT